MTPVTSLLSRTVCAVISHHVRSRRTLAADRDFSLTLPDLRRSDVFLDVIRNTITAKQH